MNYLCCNRFPLNNSPHKSDAPDQLTIPMYPETAKRQELIAKYTDRLRELSKLEAEVKELGPKIAEKKEQADELERQANSFQIVGMYIAEVLRPLSDERFMVKTLSDSRHVVGVRKRLDVSLLKNGTRVALDMTTKTIMHILPREVDPNVYHMSIEDPGDVSYTDVGGLGDQLNEIREVIELPIQNPAIFERVGVPPPKGALLYGPPGTGKTLIARAIAHNTNANFIKVVATAVFQSYFGESARIIREMFSYARDHAPCIIFIDEIDALGGKRMSNGSGVDRENQRTLMELLAQMDGFSSTSTVKVIMATNRPDILDPALIRPGRLDRRIEIPLPNEQGRLEILKIHSKKLTLSDEIDFDAVVKMSEGFNGADIRNICTEAGLFALREDREFINNEDFMKAVRTVKEAKGMESVLHYEKV